MDNRQVYDAQQKLTRALVLVLVPILRPFLGSKPTPGLIRALVRAIFPAVAQSRELQRELARRVYTELKLQALPDAEPIGRPDLREYREDFLYEAVAKIPDLESQEDVIDTDFVSRVINKADMHSRNAYRNQALAYAIHDKDILGFARVDPEPPTCELCRLAISRGPAYTSEQAAATKLNDNMERVEWHPGCTCIVVSVFKGQEQSWDGYDQWMEELGRYNNATKGKSGKELRKAWRKAVAESNRSAQRRESAEEATKDPGLSES